MPVHLDADMSCKRGTAWRLRQWWGQRRTEDAMTTQEQALVDEIVAHGGVLVETRETYDPIEDVILVELLMPLVDEGVEDSPEAVRAALEDMGEDPGDWLDMD